MTKKIKRTKKEILEHINELRLNVSALSVIHKRLKEEKREGLRFDFFHEKDITGKKHDILNMIRREEGIITVAPPPPSPSQPLYTGDIGSRGIEKILLRPMEEKSTGIMKIIDGQRYGETGFQDGEVIYTIFNGMKGEKAFFDLARVKEGGVEFYPRESIDKERTIDRATSLLIKRTLKDSCTDTFYKHHP